MKKSISFILIITSLFTFTHCTTGKLIRSGPAVFGFLSESSTFSFENISSHPKSHNTAKKCSFSLENTLYADVFYGNSHGYSYGKAIFYIDASNFEITDPSGIKHNDKYTENCDLDLEKYAYDEYENIESYYSQKFSLKYTGDFSNKFGYISFGTVSDSYRELTDVWYYSISEDKTITFSYKNADNTALGDATPSMLSEHLPGLDTVLCLDIQKGKHIVVDNENLLNKKYESDCIYIYAMVNDPNVYAFRCDSLQESHDDSAALKNASNADKVIMLDEYIDDNGKYYMIVAPVLINYSTKFPDAFCYRFDAHDAANDVSIQIIAVTEQLRTPESIKALFENSAQ